MKLYESRYLELDQGFLQTLWSWGAVTQRRIVHKTLTGETQTSLLPDKNLSQDIQVQPSILSRQEDV